MSPLDLEQPLVFPCGDHNLAGMLHPDEQAKSRRGVLVVVGGPQCRVGSHRQFVLLARHLAAHGLPVLRFDYRGMGDSGGELRDFSAVGTDIRAAIDAFQEAVPTVQEIVIWGLCDAASAAAFYGWQDDRVKGLVLLNPWIRTAEGAARTVLRHYYVQRLLSRDFWSKLFSGRLHLTASLGEMLGLWRTARGKGEAASSDPTADMPLPDRMLHGLQHFSGRVLLILSGNDLTAQEFVDHAEADKGWRNWLQTPALERRELEAADHTFSRAEWRDEVNAITLEWSRSW